MHVAKIKHVVGTMDFVATRTENQGHEVAHAVIMRFSITRHTAAFRWNSKVGLSAEGIRCHGCDTVFFFFFGGGEVSLTAQTMTICFGIV